MECTTRILNPLNVWDKCHLSRYVQFVVSLEYEFVPVVGFFMDIGRKAHSRECNSNRIAASITKSAFDNNPAADVANNSTGGTVGRQIA